MQIELFSYDVQTRYCPQCQKPHYHSPDDNQQVVIVCGCGYAAQLYTWPFYLWRDRDRIIRQYVR